MTELPTGTVTFLFTDIEGSTRLLKQVGDAYGQILADHQRILRAAFAEHGGHEIDTQGDSFFFAFRRAKDAVAAAIGGQRALAAHSWPAGVELRVRMGLHSGEPVVGEKKYVGIGVHRAARIGAAGHGGQVLLSSSTRELVEDDLPEGVSLRDLGQVRLKDIDRAERTSQLAADGLRLEFPPLRGAEPVATTPVLRRRSLLVAMLAGVAAAAVAIPVFALGSGAGGSGKLRALTGDSVGLIDPATATITGDVTGVPAPDRVAEGAGAIWVASPQKGTVSRIDETTRSLRQTIDVGNNPSGLAFGDGALWVANRLDGTVSRIDPATNHVVQTTPVGSSPAGIAYGAGSVWVANVDDRTLSRIDARSGNVVRTIATGAAGAGVAVSPGSVWVSDGAGSSLIRVDVRTDHVTQSVNVGSGPTAIVYGSGSVWVANTLDGTVSRVDARSGVVTATARVGVGPSGLAVREGTVWVSDGAGRRLARIDPVTNAVTRALELGNRPGGLAFGRGGLWIAVQPSTAAHRGGTLVAVSSFPLGSIDPTVAYLQTNLGIITLTNDGLVGYRRVGGGEGNDVVPDLAASMPTVTDGGRTYTFQLRRGIRYSTGVQVRPGDFRRALERNFELNSVAAQAYVGIVGAKACLGRSKGCDLSRGVVGDDAAGTVAFHLVEPDPEFLRKLALTFADAVPPGTPAHDVGTHPLPATGPYEIASYVPNHVLRLVRNPRFHAWSQAAQPDGYPDRIVLRFEPSPAQALTAVERGTADVTLDDPPPDRLHEAETQYASQVHVQPEATTLFLQLNTRVPPFDDVRVRRALNYAIDRAKVAELFGGPEVAKPTCQILPPNFPGYRPYCPYTRDPGPGGGWTAPDLEQAKRLIAASGTRGARVTLWSASIFDAPAGYVSSLLRELGYRVSTRRFTDPDKYSAAITDSRSRAQIAIRGWIADYPGASDFFYPLLSCEFFRPADPVSNANGSEFCDPRIDAELQRALAEQLSEPLAANELWARIDRQVVDKAPWVSLVTPQRVSLVSRRVGNFQRHPQFGVLLDQLWVK